MRNTVRREAHSRREAPRLKWPHAQLGRIARVESGFGFPREAQGIEGEEYPFFKVSDMNLAGNEVQMHRSKNTVSAETLIRLGAKLFPAGTVIFPKIGAAIATEKKRLLTLPATYDNNVMGIIPGPEIEAKFLYYWLQTIKLSEMSNKGPVPSLRKSAIEDLVFPLPPLLEQRYIIDILDQASHLRRLRAEADAKVDRILPALFIKMFGNPSTNAMGWTSRTLGDLAEHLTSGSRAWAAYTGRGSSFFIRTQDINKGEIGIELLPVDPPDNAEAERTRVRQGDILVTITGVVGKAAVCRDSSRTLYVSQHVALVRPKRHVLHPEYLAGYANLPLGDIPALARFQYGQTKPGLGFRELRSALIPLPPIELQAKFAEHLAILRNTRRAVTSSSQALDRLWTILLHRAFCGSLTASWRNAHLKELLQEMERQRANLGTTYENIP